MASERFTYPFCYTPSPEISEAARRLIAALKADDSLDGLFSEGKMMGVLEVRDAGGGTDFLYAFSGLAGGRAVIGGFVPPILDITDPDGYFRRTEAAISSPDDSRALQDWLFGHYVVMNGLGEEASVKEIFARRGLVPPGGTGDCAAPKLLNYAFRHGLHPVAMGEFWYGASPASEVREEGRFYPSCTGKCGPLLSWMMQGLDVEDNPLDFAGGGEEYAVIYEDGAVIVVDKPSGMLSVPGRTKAVSLLDRLKESRPEVYTCHRLDMDTSGLMVFAKTPGCQADIQMQFETRQVGKTYSARLEAGSRPFKGKKSGTIALPLSTDWYDRPRQMVDFEHGKPAITRYEVTRILPDGEIDVRFTPLTGRTHQLRVHAAHQKGLGHPIKGDRLYGTANGGRLCLRADSLSFRHPVTGEEMRFELDGNQFPK